VHETTTLTKLKTYKNCYLCWNSCNGHIGLDQIMCFVITGEVSFYVALDICYKNFFEQIIICGEGLQGVAHLGTASHNLPPFFRVSILVLCNQTTGYVWH
jgi:hypothetical protein